MTGTSSVDPCANTICFPIGKRCIGSMVEAPRSFAPLLGVSEDDTVAGDDSKLDGTGLAVGK